MSEVELYPLYESVPEEVVNPGYFKRAAAAVMTVAGVAAMTSPSAAAEESAMSQACHAMPVYDHRGEVGANPRIGPNENTIRSLEATAVAGGNRIETDMQVDGDGKVVDIHDPTLQRTTNGTGKVRDRSSAYIRRLHTPDGSKVPFLPDLIEFMVDHSNMYGQFEFKPYKTWTPKVLKDTVNAITDAGLEDRVHFTSGSLNILKRIRDINPNYRLEWIGFTTRPSLHKAALAGIPQVNVTYDQGFHAYGGYKTYINAAHHQGIDVSVRSHANGVGDEPKTWEKEVRQRVKQIVTNNHPKYRKWCNQQ